MSVLHIPPALRTEAPFVYDTKRFNFAELAAELFTDALTEHTEYASGSGITISKTTHSHNSDSNRNR